MKTALLAILACCIAAVASAGDLVVVEITPDNVVAVAIDDGDVNVLGAFDSLTVIQPTPPEPPEPEPTDTGQLICLRPWSCTLDESDADLTIRESIDAVGSGVPYISVLPGVLDQRMQPHKAIEHYRGLVPDASKAYVFHVVPTKQGPVIANQGPLDAETVLGWVGVPIVSYRSLRTVGNEDEWFDIDFEKERPDLCGVLEPDETRRDAFAALQDVSTLPGFRGIPRSEWEDWTARFPMSRLVKSIRHVTKQAGGSCVGHSCINNVEGGKYMMAGDLFFRSLSGQSMYHRIGRSPNSGAYVFDAVEECMKSGILPLRGETDIDGKPYPHDHPDGNFYTKLLNGWEATAQAWRANVYLAKTEEHAFRILMDNRLRINIARSRHSISLFAATSSGRWAYENSWGTSWGDFGCSVGYDSRVYGEIVYHPVLRDEIQILVAEPARREAEQPAKRTKQPATTGT